MKRLRENSCFLRAAVVCTLMMFAAVGAAVLASLAPPHTIEISSGVFMPMLAAGTWQYNDSVAAASVVAALQAGFDHIDTAADYKNQKGVSMGLARSGRARSSMFITSKVPGCGLQGIRPGHCEADTLKAVQQDVAELSSSFPDLKQIDVRGRGPNRGHLAHTAASPLICPESELTGPCVRRS